MSIPFTQYLRPNGRRRGVEIGMPQEVEDLANSFIAAGGRYECEELMTGHASLTAVYEIDGEDQDIAYRSVRQWAGGARTGREAGAQLNLAVAGVGMKSSDKQATAELLAGPRRR